LGWGYRYDYGNRGESEENGEGYSRLRSDKRTVVIWSYSCRWWGIITRSQAIKLIKNRERHVET
jgi:hypothetical protein